MELKELQSVYNDLTTEEERLQSDIRGKEKENFKLLETKKMLQYKIEQAKRKVLSIDKELSKIDNHILEAQNSLTQVRNKLAQNRKEVREKTLSISANNASFAIEESAIMAGINASIVEPDSIFEDFSISVEPSQAVKESLLMEESNIPLENTFEKAVSGSRKEKEFVVGTQLGYVYSFKSAKGQVSVKEIMQLGEAKQFIGKFKEYYVFFEIFNENNFKPKSCVVYFYDSLPTLIGKTSEIDYSEEGGVFYSFNGTFFISPHGILMSAVKGKFLLISLKDGEVKVKEYDWNHSYIIRDIAFTDENTMFCITKPDKYVFKVEKCKTVASRQLKCSTWSLCVDHPTTVFVGTAQEIVLLKKESLRIIATVEVGYKVSFIQNLTNMLLVGTSSGHIWTLEATKWYDICKKLKGGKALDDSTFLVYGFDRVEIYDKYTRKLVDTFNFKGRIERFLEI